MKIHILKLSCLIVSLVSVYPTGYAWQPIPDELRDHASHVRYPRIDEINDDKLVSLFEKQSILRDLPPSILVKDNEYLIQAAIKTLETTPVDWNAYRVALWIGKLIAKQQPQWIDIARKVFQGPRGEKINDDHGLAIIDTLDFLCEIGTEDAANLLSECIYSEFWDSGPVRSKAIATDPLISLSYIRHKALSGLRRMNFDIALPILNELKKDFPVRRLDQKLSPDEEIGLAILRTIYEINLDTRAMRIRPYVQKGQETIEEYFQILTGITLDKYFQKEFGKTLTEFGAQSGISKEQILKMFEQQLANEKGCEIFISLSFKDFLQNEGLILPVRDTRR